MIATYEFKCVKCNSIIVERMEYEEIENFLVENVCRECNSGLKRSYTSANAIFKGKGFTKAAGAK